MNTLKTRAELALFYFLWWLGYFAFSRFLFLIFYMEKTREAGLLTSIKTFVYGIQLDLSFTGYLSLIPFLILMLTVPFRATATRFLLKAYSYPIIALTSLLIIIDTVLYKSWGVRIDSTLFNYISTPKIMLASVSGTLLVVGIFIWLSFTAISCYTLNKTLQKPLSQLAPGKLWELPVFLVVIALLILPIRGGFQTVPINQSNVYFSNNMFANHAAINCIWNLGNTLTHKTEDHNPYTHFDTKIAQEIIEKRRTPLLQSTDSVLLGNKPNVLLIIWESLSAKAVGSLNGTEGVTEHLDQLGKEGILFSNFYGNGDRTDKGLPAILSGYYPQPTQSIIKTPHKTRSLPMLTAEMKKLGYTTSFYYGGDTNFGNMNTYLRNGQIDQIVEGNEFDRADWNSKWGAHDHIMLERCMRDLKEKQSAPFFTIALTLTSHEPYEFPDEYKFGKRTETDLYKSAQAYTDAAIGAFIAEAKQQTWWDNTLVIIVADHGHPLPKHEGYFNAPKKFQIPMIWLGGALKQKGVVNTNVGSQIDIPYTLLDLLKGDKDAFSFGSNLFNHNEQHYAHYIFNKGFGTVSKSGAYVYDYVSNKPALTQGTTDDLEKLGKAISQEAYQDYLDK
jgi:phosphoglycerol transferase MdoB-like AlkP superfamily enzyme